MSNTLLSVKGLTKKFGGLVANSDISFDLQRGEVLGILGPNGAGKTTLFNLITGYTRPTSGTVVLNGVDVTGRAPHQIAQMGLLRTFQLCRPFRGMTVRENIQIACDGPRLQGKVDPDEHIEAIIASVGLSDLIDTPAASLPYGSQRRLEIARALSMKPELILLDEPFAGLGSQEIDQLSGLLRRLHADEGLNIIIIEHKLKEFMKLVDRVVVIDFGKMIADGKPDDIIKDPNVVRAYIGGDEHEPA